MFIELSDGSIINTDHISFIRKDTDPYEFVVFPHPRYFVAFSGYAGTLLYHEEDANKIKALLLPDESRWQDCNSSRNVVLSEFNCKDTAEFVEGLHCD